MKTSPRVAAILSILLASAGCSAVFVQAPPDQLEDAYRLNGCTESPAVPIVDATVATTLVVLALATAGSMRADGGPAMAGEEISADLRPGLAIAAGALAVPFGVSSWRGFRTTDRCRRLVAAHRVIRLGAGRAAQRTARKSR